MTSDQKKYIKKYKREVRRLLPIFTKNEKRFFNDICMLIENYAEENPDFTLDSLLQEIGEPKDVVYRYLLDMDASLLRKSLSHASYIRIAVVCVIVTVLSAGFFKMGTDYLSYIEGRDAYINRETIEVITYTEAETPSENEN